MGRYRTFVVEIKFDPQVFNKELTASMCQVSAYQLKYFNHKIIAKSTKLAGAYQIFKKLSTFSIYIFIFYPKYIFLIIKICIDQKTNN